MVNTGSNKQMKNGLCYEIHFCLEPALHFTPQRWKDEIRKGWQQMSAQSRWKRFASASPELTEEQLDYLTNIDGKDHVAWCALIHHEQDFRGIAVARFIRLQDEVGIAEFAVTVIDEFQNQGIGFELLEKLIHSAQTRKIDTLRGYISPGNQVMIRLCQKFQASFIFSEGLIQADIRIAERSIQSVRN